MAMVVIGNGDVLVTDDTAVTRLPRSITARPSAAKSAFVSEKNCLAAVIVTCAGSTLKLTHAGVPLIVAPPASVAPGRAQFCTVSRVVGWYGAPVDRRVSRRATFNCRLPPVGS